MPRTAAARRQTRDSAWRPELSPDGPLYRALADAISEAVASGALGPGDRLPPVRELAWSLGVTPGTVARAYHLAENRGLLEGQVGRGTFVKETRAPGADAAMAAFAAAGPSGAGAGGGNALTLISFPPATAAEGIIADMRSNRAIDVGQDAILTERLEWLIAKRGALPFTRYNPFGEDVEEREAAARWLSAGGLPHRPEDTVICFGAQHGLLVALAATSAGGDAVALTEPLIHPGMKDCARALGLRLEPVAADPHLGLEPEALDAAAARLRPSAIILSANTQNPTLATMPLERREAIAEIARRRRIPLIEDDVYGWTRETRLPSFPQLAPEQCWYVSSLSKCVAAGLRAGFLLCPPERGPQAARLLQGYTQHVPWLISALAAALINEGDAAEIVASVRAETVRRAARLAEILQPTVENQNAALTLTDDCSMAWLELPEPWRALDFEAAAWKAGVGVVAAEAFAVGRTHAPHAVRIAYGAAETEAVEAGARRLAALLTAGPPPPDIRA